MSCCQQFVHCLPSLAVWILIAWSYYVYVFIICTHLIADILKQSLYLIFYHVLLVATVISYCATMFCKKDRVPSRYKLQFILNELIENTSSHEEVNRILQRICRNRGIVVYTVNTDGTIRTCKICNHIKPDRTHHCSTCKTCKLKMDHHCPWVNNCISFSNQKVFIVLLFYGALYCTFTFATSIEFVVRFYRDTFETVYGYQIVAMTILSVSVQIMIMSMLFFHLSLVTSNVTTLENLRQPVFVNSELSFDLGCMNNFVEVFGEACCLWLLPIKTSAGDGLEFPVHTDI